MAENAIEEEALSEPHHYVHDVNGLTVFQGIYHVNLICFETFELAVIFCSFYKILKKDMKINFFYILPLILPFLFNLV